MAKLHNYTRKSNSNSRSEIRPSILATCYAVDARSAMLKGLHYSTTGAGGRASLFASLAPVQIAPVQIAPVQIPDEYFAD